MSFARLQFSYVNWRDEEHVYVVAPTNLVFAKHPTSLAEEKADFHWMLNCQVLGRDGEARPGIRSFILTGLRDVVEVAPDE